MRRLRRILFHLLTILSLLLCAATLALWVRSYWREDAYNLPFRIAGNRNDGFTPRVQGVGAAIPERVVLQ